MRLAATAESRPLRPTFWARLWQDMQPHPGRATEAARIAVAGMLIVAVQMTLRYELLYPAMTTLLVVNEIRGYSTLTRFLINFVAVTVSCGAAVALMALFMQQPMFLLPIMAAYITVVMYFMGASRYRSAMFNLGYPFVVVVYMAFFDKTHAEHIAIIVYKSVITGLACGTLVLMLLWPESASEVLREQLVHGLKGSAGVLRRLAAASRGQGTFDPATFVPDRFRARTPKLMLLADQVQVDCGLGERGRHELFTLVSLNARAAACVGVVVEQRAVGRAVGPAEAESIERLAEAIERVVEALEAVGQVETRGSDAEATAMGAPVVTTPDPSKAGDALGGEIGDIRDLLESACEDARRAMPAIEVLERTRRLPDILTLTLRNLRDMADRVVLQPIRQPNPAMVKHAFKCSITIMICALFCIAINWTMGIGCVETVMLVVQGTFGGTLLIGGLRMAGVVLGYAIAIMLIIFLIPTVTTLPGFWLVFGGTLFLTSWGVAGPPRVGVPCLQAMIVTDFALLQTTRPDISLLPAMNFALAVAMGVLVTVAVYWLLWPVQAGKVVRPTLAFMLQRVSAALQRAAAGSLSGQAANVMQSTLDEELAKCVAAHTHAQFERHESTRRHELELRAVMVVEQACHRAMVSLAAPAGEAPPRAGEAAWLHWASARFAAAAACVQGAACPDGPQGTRPVERADRFGEVVRAADMLARLPAILVELEAHPEGERVRLGLA